MTDFVASTQQAKFVMDLDNISPSLAAWAQELFDTGCSLEFVKGKLRSAMTVVERH